MFLKINTFKHSLTTSLSLFDRIGGVLAEGCGGSGGGVVLVAAWTVVYRCRHC